MMITWDDTAPPVRLSLPLARHTPEQATLQRELVRTIHAALDTLSDRQRQAVRARFGLDTGRPALYREVAAEMGISVERTRQHIQNGLDRLRGSVELSYLCGVRPITVTARRAMLREASDRAYAEERRRRLEREIADQKRREREDLAAMQSLARRVLADPAYRARLPEAERSREEREAQLERELAAYHSDNPADVDRLRHMLAFRLGLL